MIYIKVLSVALIMFIALRSASALFIILVGKKNIRKVFHRIFPVVEMLAWFAYIFWAVNTLFGHLAIYNLLTALMIFVLVATFAWYLLRDFVSGIILKAENGFEPGHKIDTAEISGTIKKLGYRSIEIENNEGAHVKIPFSRLSRLNISKPADTYKWVESIVEFEISTSFHSDKIKKMLEMRLLEMPWIVSGDNIKIIISRDKPGAYHVKVRFRSINNEMALKTEENVRLYVKQIQETNS